MTDIAYAQFSLTAAEQEAFWTQGYFGPFHVLDEDVMVKTWRTQRLSILDRSNAVYTEDWALSGNTNISNYDRHLDNGFLADVITNPRITDRVASVIGPDVLCWRTTTSPRSWSSRRIGSTPRPRVARSAASSATTTASSRSTRTSSPTSPRPCR